MIISEDKTITIGDAREFFKGCVPGWKTFAEAHGYDWVTVVRHGLKASELLACDDAMATALVKYVYERDNIPFEE